MPPPAAARPTAKPAPAPRPQAAQGPHVGGACLALHDVRDRERVAFSALLVQPERVGLDQRPLVFAPIAAVDRLQQAAELLVGGDHDLVQALDVDAHDVAGIPARVLVQDAQADRLLLARVQPQADRDEPLVVALAIGDLPVDVVLVAQPAGAVVDGDRRAVLHACAADVVDRAPIGDRRQPSAEVADLACRACASARTARATPRCTPRRGPTGRDGGCRRRACRGRSRGPRA